MIQYGEVYFSPPSKLNDPFDFAFEPTPPKKADFKSRRNFIAASLVRQSGGNLDTQIAQRLAWKKLTEMGGRFDFEDNFEGFLDEGRRERDKTFGVLSLSEEPLSHLMWPHYSDNHKGICIGIKAHALADKFIPNEHSCRVILSNHRMKYTDIYPETDILVTGGYQKILRRQLDTKFDAWEYEEERRVLMSASSGIRSEGILESDRTIQLGPDVIDKIILGMRTPDDVEKEIIDLLRVQTHPPSLSRVVRKYDSFELTTEPIHFQ